MGANGARAVKCRGESWWRGAWRAEGIGERRGGRNGGGEVAVGEGEARRAGVFLEGLEVRGEW